MTARLANTGNRFSWNGYEEYSSAEAVIPLMRAHEGRRVSQYPHMHPELVYPFHVLDGFRGLIILNAMAYAATVALCCGMARELFQDKLPALNASLLLVFVSFSWEYSQKALTQPPGTLFVTAPA